MANLTLKSNGGGTTSVIADFFKGSLKSLYTINTVENLDAFIPNSGLGYAVLEDEAAAASLNKTDGCIIALGFGTSYGAQMYFDDGSGEGGMAIRNRSSSTSWHPWRQVLTEGNYTSYTVTKTGGGASGTWGISVSGNAATSTKFASAQSISLTGDTTGSASSQAGWSISTITNKISYSTQLTTDANINAFNVANKLQVTTWNSTSSPGVSNGIIINGGWTSADYGFQIAIDDDPTWYIALRQKNASGWNAWKRIPMADGTGASGTWGISVSGAAQHLSRTNYYSKATDLDAFIDNKLQWCVVTADAVSGIGNDGNVISIGSSTSWGTQIWFDDGAGHGGMAIRSRKSGGWNSWYKILDAYNYTSYTVTKTGSGASGNWSISISGNAATATALTTSAGSGLKPVYFSSGKPVACSYQMVPAYYTSGYNCNTIYDTSIIGIASGSNCPSGSQYGAMLTMPYRSPSGNSTPDYGAQLFLPNGDDNTTPDGMYYRTSTTSWRSWKSVIHSNCKTYYGSETTMKNSSGASNGDVFFVI